MKHTLEKCINTVQRNRQKFRRYLSVFLVLSMITTLGVNWGLHQNGISLAQTSDYICGLPEHTHTDDCYEKVLICGYDENGYPIASASNAAAKDTTAASAETGAAETKAAETAAAESAAAETEAETASADTASASNALAESAAKTDADSTLEGIFAGLTGTGLHGTLTAGAETASVFAETAAAAAAAQTAVHVHTDACYEMKLICGLEEHIHTPSCLGSDISAGRETAKDWEATLPTDDELTGIWADDLVRVALSQLGYTECIENYVLDEKGEEQRSYSRYGAWYGNEYGEWNAMFVAFCLHYANVPTDSVPVNSGCQSWAAKLKNEAVDLYRAAADYTPKAGDLIFFDQNEDGRADRMGIVEAVTLDEETGALTRIDTIEGDVEGTVAECGYEGTDATVLGYGEMPEVRMQTIDTENYTVTVTYTEAAKIPDDAIFTVTEYGVESDEYAKAVAETGEDYDWLMDISFIAGDVEIEPQAQVYLAVAPLDMEDIFDDETEGDNADLATDSDADDTAEDVVGVKDDDAQTSGVLEDAKSIQTQKKIIHFGTDGVETVYGAINKSATKFSLGSLSLAGQVKEWMNIMLDTSALSDTPVNVFNEYEDGEQSEPDYEKSNSLSIGNTGNTTLKGLNDSSVFYASDPATSNIEDSFDGIESQNGKVLTDKTVIYGNDDYSAFSDYEEGVFGVTLSALGQEFSVQGEDSYEVPVDVVFVLDASGSMNRNYVDTKKTTTRREAMVKAVNKAMKYIFDQNNQNRVGVVVYSSYAGKLLDLDYYKPNSSNEYVTISNNNVMTASGLTRGKTGYTTRVQQTQGCNQNYGTFTQYGIALGNSIFQSVEDTTYTVTTAAGETITGQRQPIMILLSDGEPTHGNEHYDDVIGNLTTGSSGDGNVSDPNKVMFGYYTILSANSYKEKITGKYKNTAKFYTIGEGIEEAKNTSSDFTLYCNAVLNPSKSTMDLLNQKNGNWVNSLKSYLGNTARENTSSDVGKYGLCTNDYVYYHRHSLENYSYSDGSYFGNMDDSELENAFKTMIDESVTPVKYVFALADSTNVVLTDPIGRGMEIKGEPVLRYGERNYTVTSTESYGNTTVYHYSHKTTYGESFPANYPANSGTHHASSGTIDLNEIVVTVTKDADGNQTLKMEISADVLPVIYPDSSGTIYYKELPVRLIYQVGLTETALAEADQLKDGQTKDYFTNRYEGTSAEAVFTKNDENPYTFNDPSKEKSENATGTNTDYFSEATENNRITQTLGNNGKLTIKKGGTTDITVNKVWSDNHANHDDITVRLMQKTFDSNGNSTEKQYLSAVTLSSGNWSYTWKDLPLRNSERTETYTYRVIEDEVKGYVTNYESSSDLSGTTWTITNIPTENTGLSVKKVWKRSSGDEIKDTSKLPAIKAELHQKDEVEETKETGVTLTVQAYYRTKKGNDWGNYNTETIGTYTVKQGSNFSATVYGARNGNQKSISAISLTSGSATASKDGDYGITVNGIQSDTTVLVSFDDRLGSRPSIQNPSYSTPGTIAGSTKTKSLGEFTLSADNNWQRFWTAEELGEQAGHTYSYWVTENTVTGYKTSVDYKSEDNALTPTDENKTITITNTQEALTLTVKKVWDDDGADRPEKITVFLLKNGEQTGDSVELTAENNWTAVFDNLDASGNYSVEEDTSGNFNYTVDYECSGVTYAGSGFRWIRADGFSDGETYLIVTSPDSGTVIGMQAASDGTSFAWTQGKEGEKNAGTVLVSANADGTTYITDEEAKEHTDMQWTAESVGLKKGNQVGSRYAFSLKNVKTETYAKNNGQGDMTEKVAEKEGWFYYGYTLKDAEGEEAERKPNPDKTPAEKWQYVIGSMNDYFLLDNNHAGDGNSEGAQTFYLYKRVETKGYTQTATITNHKSYSLPSTGGAGTTPFTVGGSVLTGAALLYGYHLMRKREGGTE